VIKIFPNNNTPILSRIKTILLALLFLGAAVHAAAPLLPTTGGVIDPDYTDTQTELPGSWTFPARFTTEFPGR